MHIKHLNFYKRLQSFLKITKILETNYDNFQNCI